MKYTELGNSGIEVSRICLGCMGFGKAEAGFHKWTLPYEDTKKIIKIRFSSCLCVFVLKILNYDFAFDFLC